MTQDAGKVRTLQEIDLGLIGHYSLHAITVPEKDGTECLTQVQDLLGIRSM